MACLLALSISHSDRYRRPLPDTFHSSILPSVPPYLHRMSPIQQPHFQHTRHWRHRLSSLPHTSETIHGGRRRVDTCLAFPGGSRRTGTIVFRGGRAGMWSCMVWFWDVDSLIFLLSTPSPSRVRASLGLAADTTPSYLPTNEGESV